MSWWMWFYHSPPLMSNCSFCAQTFFIMLLLSLDHTWTATVHNIFLIYWYLNPSCPRCVPFLDFFDGSTTQDMPNSQEPNSSRSVLYSVSLLTGSSISAPKFRQSFATHNDRNLNIARWDLIMCEGHIITQDLLCCSKTSSSDALPEGFFDDPKLDAKVIIMV